ncbi:MAG: iron-sulfur cluster repair di-iron protein [Ilumatobacteraceae bacterium]|nr:iron-sulfur cluster repair di-iron protein [Ilumatobacteraceae bacterium]
MSLNLEDTLAEIVTASPSLARDLERFGLDYCCGGTATLEQSCRENDLDPDDVRVALDAALVDEPAPPWSTMDLVELLDHIESTHHRYLHEELPRLSALTLKVVEVHGDRHPELAAIGSCFAEIRADIEPHLMKEERVLFPMMRELVTAADVPAFPCGPLQNPISAMLYEHETLGELLGNLRKLTGGYAPPADGCGSYVALFDGYEHLELDTHLHIHKENYLLFPEVVRLESARQQTAAT